MVNGCQDFGYSRPCGATRKNLHESDEDVDGHPSIPHLHFLEESLVKAISATPMAQGSDHSATEEVDTIVINHFSVCLAHVSNHFRCILVTLASRWLALGSPLWNREN